MTSSRSRRPAGAKRDRAPAKDPHEQAILNALDGHLDPDLFEKCATDLLSSIYPSLVPVRGGSDGGFDGEIWVPGENACPLVATTGQDFEANLRGSLTRATASGQRAMAVFATSRRVTPGKRRKLLAVANQLHVAQLPIHDKDWFAQRLYRDSAWCLQLLGITGRPCALVRTPPLQVERVHASQLVGRDEVLARLAGEAGDVVLSGGPGFGKTAVLAKLAESTGGYFAVDVDRTALANAIRELRPPLVIVDDAGVNLDLLGTLTIVRSQVAAAFRIVASCWVAQTDAVTRVLETVSPTTVPLELLNADEIVEVVRAAGLAGPVELMRRIVRQAEGRPGLASTLARAALDRGTRDVLTGQALLSQLDPLFKENLGLDVVRLLGCFSLGGKLGMEVAVVAEHLRHPVDEVASHLSRLSPAGVIRESRRDAISVWPAELRFALIARTFFSAPRIPLRKLLDAAPNRRDALETLIGARWTGADVPELEALVAESSDADIWAQYASLGEHEALRALTEKPDFLNAIAGPALECAPTEALSKLFHATQRNGDQEGLRKRLESWARGIDDPDLMLQRSKILVDASVGCFRQTGDAAVAVSATCVALQPDYATTTSDPGQGRTVTFAQGLLGPPLLEELARLWPAIVNMLRESRTLPWRALLDLVRRWVFQAPLVTPTPELEATMVSIARVLVQDLAVLACNHNGAKRELRTLALALRTELSLQLDPEFEALYPDDSGCSIESWREKLKGSVDVLADSWVHVEPPVVAAKLQRFALEMAEVMTNPPSNGDLLCYALADRCDSPGSFLDAFIHAKMDRRLAWFFARKCAATDANGTIALLLASPGYESVALEICFLVDGVDLATVDRAIAATERPAAIIGSWIRQHHSEQLVRHLLTHPRDDVAVTAALALWKHDHRDPVLEKLDTEWSAALVRCDPDAVEAGDHYWFREILVRTPNLAFAWTCGCLKRESPVSYPWRKLAEEIAPMLSETQRRDVLMLVPSQGCYGRLISRLVGHDVGRYQFVLAQERLKAFHLVPLAEDPCDGWVGLVLAAHDAGYGVPKLADATFPGSWSWSGNESEFWQRRASALEQFARHTELTIREVVRLAMATLRTRITRRLEEERLEAVRGIGT
jgi:hypothetical protein